MKDRPLSHAAHNNSWTAADDQTLNRYFALTHYQRHCSRRGMLMRLSFLKMNFRGAKMSKGMLKLTTPLMILALMAFYIEAKPQEPAFDGLEKYLNQRRVGPEAIRVIR